MKIEPFYKANNGSINSDGDLNGVSISYLVSDASSEENALNFAYQTVSKTHQNLYLSDIEIVKRVNDSAWEIDANYDYDKINSNLDDNNLPKSEDTFTVVGQRVVMKKSLKHLGTFSPSEKLLSEKEFSNFQKHDPYGGLINIKNGKASGIEMQTGKLSINKTCYFSDSFVDENYIKKLATCYFCINNKPFLGYERGEILFTGVNGTRTHDSSKAPWRINFSFVYSPNQANLLIPAITEDNQQQNIHILRKYGHDFLWYEYKKIVTADGVEHEAVARAHLERIYNDEDLNMLGVV
ncbi:hypothetical protein AAEX28_07080 [Lentisphaerota bacterium WC36G]|nr:hypothetical protein LJT99_09945 [Lentisphaerae bacterium WC36]